MENSTNETSKNSANEAPALSEVERQAIERIKAKSAPGVAQRLVNQLASTSLGFI